MAFCLVGLGSNQGNRLHLLETAVARLAANSQTRVIAVSSWHETKPIGGPLGQPQFLNGAVVAETSLVPVQLLAHLQQIEQDLGRQRTARWAERPIDLDLLLYDSVALDTPVLKLPHPRMAWRRFVLQPAGEIAAEMVHPTTGWSIARLLEHLNTTPPYVAITGCIAVGKTHLAQRLAAGMAAHWLAEEPDWRQLTAFYADPAGHAWQTELEFLEERTRLLAAAFPPDARCPTVAAHRWTVSDFWFNQSRAFARVWLSPEKLSAFEEHWRRQSRHVARPRLIVLLDAPAPVLLARMHARGRACEQPLTEAMLERIRQAILQEVEQPDMGPVLRLNNHDHDAAFTEVLAAVQATE